MPQRPIADALARRKHPVSHTKVAQILRHQGYSLQGNRKTEEGEDHPDRDAQFRHINSALKLKQGWPVISVDTKKKERTDRQLLQRRPTVAFGETDAPSTWT